MRVLAGVLAATLLLSVVQGAAFADNKNNQYFNREYNEAFKRSETWHNHINYIDRVEHAGLMTGYPDGDFHPRKTINRAEFANILVRTFNIPSETPEASMKDVKKNWAQEDINAVVAAGLIEPNKWGWFRPNATMTRAEAYDIFARAFEKFQLRGESPEATGRLADLPDGNHVPSKYRSTVSLALKEGFVNTGENADKIRPYNRMSRGDVAFMLSKYIEQYQDARQ